MTRKLFAEFLGTLLLLAVVIGSGIMGETLSGGNVGIALLINAIATGAALVVLIEIFGPISGAHFNPAVTLGFNLQKDISAPHSAAYIIVQIIGAVLGVWLAHLMFDQSILQLSEKIRTSTGLFVAEVVATFGLVFAILAAVRLNPKAVPMIVGLYITAAYFFTASTSFANPAVTIARALSDTFAGIAPVSVLPFITAQIVGAVLAAVTAKWLYKE
ncbi:MAG: aquaporin family protein [Hellea sp.]|nr:aquaporin family protein [Hellea sp.]